MTGDRLRVLRIGQQLSLADVAGKADISVATLSRIENDKQALDLRLFIRLARILKVAASEILGEDNGEVSAEPLAQRVADLGPVARTKLWRDLAAAKRQNSVVKSRQPGDQLGSQVDELLAQIEFLRSELEGVRKRIRREPMKRARA
jgi:transcriptional regulator with XRE-family HTH domain